MNERIEELAKQCIIIGQPKWQAEGQYAVDSFDKEKFAKLIALKCASFAYKSGGVTNKSEKAVMEANRIYHKINEYFGIEE